LIRAGARLDLWPDGGPMLWAIERSLYRSALVLAEAGVPVDNLFYAAALNRLDLMEEFLSRGMDVNTRHWDGNTALHAAALMGHKEAVTFLLKRGADPAIRDIRWKANAAGKARYAKHAEIADIIERQ